MVSLSSSLFSALHPLSLSLSVCVCVLSFDWCVCVFWQFRSPVHPALFASVDGTGSLCLWNINEDPEVFTHIIIIMRVSIIRLSL